MPPFLNPYVFGGGGGGDPPAGPAGIEFIGSYSGTHQSTSIELALADFQDESGSAIGAGVVQVGDVVVMGLTIPVDNYNDFDNSTPIGWEQIATIDQGLFLMMAWVTTIKAGDAPLDVIQIPNPRGSVSWRATYQAMIFRGVDGDDPVGGGAVATAQGSGGAANPAPITPDFAGSWPVVFAGAAGSGNVSNTYTNTGDYSSETNHFRATRGLDTYDSGQAMGFKDDWESGTFDPVTFNDAAGGGTVRWGAITLALKPATQVWQQPERCPIELVGSGAVGTDNSAFSYSFSSLTDEDGNTPTVEPGDLVLVAVANGYIGTDTAESMTPSGYTNAYFFDNGGMNISVYWKIMGDPADTSVIIDGGLSSGFYGKAASIFVLRNVPQDNPIGALAANGQTTYGPNAPWGPLTPQGSNSAYWLFSGKGGSSVAQTSHYPYRPAGILNFASSAHWRRSAFGDIYDGIQATGLLLDYPAGEAFPRRIATGNANTGGHICVAIEILSELPALWSKFSEATEQIPAGSGSTIVSLSNLQKGDLILVMVTSDAAVGGLVSTGFTEAYSTETASPGAAVYYRVMEFNGDEEVEIAQNPTRLSAAAVQVFRASNPTQVDVDVLATVGAGGMPDAPSITPEADNSLVVAIGFLDDDLAASSVTAPAGFGDLIAANTEGADANEGATVMAASVNVNPAATTDPAAFGGDGDDVWVGVTLSIRRTGQAIPLPETSYSNPLGSGNRTGTIATSINSIGFVGTLSTLVDGVQGNGFYFSNEANATDDWIKFDLGERKFMDEFRWYQDNGTTHGTWTFEGSNDDANWATLIPSLTLGGTLGTYPITNVGRYRYYRLRALSGSRSFSPWLREIEFKVEA